MSKPKRTALQLEFPAFEQDQAMKPVQDVLSPESALIAEKIPRIEPLLRMIEGCGFSVVGFEPVPVTAKPVRRVNNSPGSRSLYQLLERRGYQIALSDPPEPAAGKAVSV